MATRVGLRRPPRTRPPARSRFHPGRPVRARLACADAPGPCALRAAIVTIKPALIIDSARLRSRPMAAANQLRTYQDRCEFTAAGKSATRRRNGRKMDCRHLPDKRRGSPYLSCLLPCTVRYRPVSCGNGATHAIDFAEPAGQRCDRGRRGAGSALPADNHRSSRHNGRRREPGRVSI